MELVRHWTDRLEAAVSDREMGRELAALILALIAIVAIVSLISVVRQVSTILSKVDGSA